MDSPSKVQDLWAIVEVMGHAQYAGRLSEYTGLGVPLVRVEVPEVDGQPAFEKLLGAASIFRITPCSEEVARATAQQLRVRPVTLVSFPNLPKQLPYGDDSDDDVDEDDPDDFDADDYHRA